MAWIPLGHEQIAVSHLGATVLTVPTGAQRLLLTTAQARIRIRDDGGLPTADAGMVIDINRSPVEYIGGLTAVRLIALDLEAKVDVLYYG